MRIKNKLLIMVVWLISTLSTAAATPGHDEGTSSGMMWSDGGSWMHSTGHMTGYNMWGMGWFGLLCGIAFWILVILLIIYLYQQVTEKGGDQ